MRSQVRVLPRPPMTEGLMSRRQETYDLPMRINAQTRNLPDDLELRHLRPFPRMAKVPYFLRSNRGRFADLDGQSTPEGWSTFYTSLGQFERGKVSYAISRAMKAGIQTVGELREVDLDDLGSRQLGDGRYRVGLFWAEFLKDAFGR